MLYSLVKTDMECLGWYLISWEHAAPKQSFCLDRWTFSNRGMIQSQDPSEANSFNKTQQVQKTKPQNPHSYLLPRGRAGETQAGKALNPPSLTNFQHLTCRSWKLGWRGNSERVQASGPSNSTTAVPHPFSHSWSQHRFRVTPLSQSCTSPLILWVFELFPHQPAALTTKFPVESERWGGERHTKVPKLVFPS